MANKGFILTGHLCAGTIKELLQKSGNVKYAFVYGSSAKAKNNYLSGIDLIVIGNSHEDRLMEKLDAKEELLKREINYKLYTIKAFSQEIKRGEPFLENILKDKKIMLIGDEDELRKISVK